MSTFRINCNIKKMYMILYMFQCFASLFSLVTEKLLKYSIALGLTLQKLKLNSLHICTMCKTYIFRYFLNRLNNILPWYYILHIFHPSLTHLSGWADDLKFYFRTTSYSFSKKLSWRGFQYHVIVLNNIKSSHIYHVFYKTFYFNCL